MTAKLTGQVSMRKVPSCCRAGGRGEEGSNMRARTDPGADTRVDRVVDIGVPPTFRQIQSLMDMRIIVVNQAFISIQLVSLGRCF